MYISNLTRETAYIKEIQTNLFFVFTRLKRNTFVFKSTTIFILDCGDPKSILNGKYAVTLFETAVNASKTLNVSQQVAYSCDEGFVFHPESSGVVNCNADTGQFEFLLPECVRRKFEFIKF